MNPDKPEGCAEPAAGIIAQAEGESSTATVDSEQKEEIRVQAQVGREAPDFEVTAYHNGEFKNVKLSSYRGKWVLVCFYPGDFTFV